MRDYELEALDQYEVMIKGTRKIRGAFFCDTEDGPMVLKECVWTEKRAEEMYQLLLHLTNEGVDVDLPIRSKEETFVTTLGGESHYLLTRWFYGRECDVRREADVLESVKKLAILHEKLQYIPSIETYELPMERSFLVEVKRHNRELRKVRTYVRNTVRKGAFELLFLQHFEEMYRQAERVECLLEESDYAHLYKQSVEKGTLIHGAYNYHNLIMHNGTVAVTNFTHFKRGVQVGDFCYFWRKVLEKHNWDVELGMKMLEVYQAGHPLGAAEKEYLYLKLLYPEKFWKTANAYYHGRKAWIPEKNVEKLALTVEQVRAKNAFLSDVFGIF